MSARQEQNGQHVTTVDGDDGPGDMTAACESGAQGLPAIDVIILSWERVDDTVAAIASARAQEGVAVSVIVIDQGSSEATLTVLRAAVQGDDNVHLHELGYNAGVAGGRNLATRLGEAEIVVSLDNDAVFVDPHVLTRVLERFDGDDKLGAIGFQILNGQTGDLDLLCWGYPKAQMAMSDQSFVTTRFVGAGHAYRRSAFDRAVGYDESLFFYWEEVDLSLQLINLGYKIIYDPSMKIYHNISPVRRFSWTGDRYFYMVRNRLYIEYKYRHSIFYLVPLAIGYIVKGAVNGVLGQALRGCLHSIPMLWRIRSGEGGLPDRLSPQAEGYIQEYEMAYRGTFWQRLRQEVLVALPGAGTSSKG
jgi:GT2 family glycosyltransferase